MIPHFQILQHGSYKSLWVQVGNRILTGMYFCLGKKKSLQKKPQSKCFTSFKFANSFTVYILLLLLSNGFNIKVTHSI